VHANGPIAPGATMGDGRYRLQRLLGAGGMATVWLADDESLARPVAVKVMADTLAADRDWVRRFEREARAAASLSHPNVVQVFDYGTERGRPFLVMQYVAGGTLRSREGNGARDLDVERLAKMTTTMPLSAIRNAAADILAGKVRGRLVVEI